MKTKILVIATIALGTLFISCDQIAEKAKDETQFAVGQANDKVQAVVDRLGLVFVEEGAKDIITYDEVNAAQQAWCDALVKIGKVCDEGGDYRSFAEKTLSEAYNYNQGKVFFKATLAFGDETFRNDKEGILAYFIGGDPVYPDDTGFALKPWAKVRYENFGANNEGIQIYGTVAITMGNIWVTDKNGLEEMVDKTWVFKKGKDGKLRIIMHKSTFPFLPNI